jgi:hypothetical protein
LTVAQTRISRSLFLHLAWSAFVLLAAIAAIGAELSAPCPPGGWLAFGDCEGVRPFAVAVLALAAVLYVGGLTGVRWWTAGLQGRGVADARAARDWYVLAAGVGMAIAPLLAFTLISMVR